MPFTLYLTTQFVYLREQLKFKKIVEDRIKIEKNVVKSQNGQIGD
jgi:hypothetical protein